MTDQTGEIPPSGALAEATLDSLAEAVARFDSHIQGGSQSSPEARRNLARIIAANREMRVRWEAAERERPQRASSGAVKVPLERKSATSLADLLKR